MAQPRPTAKSLDNLKKGNRFKKGQSGNPKGRPPQIPELNMLLAKVLSEQKSDMTAAEAILRSLFQKAIKGDVRAAEVLLERGWGKVTQQMKVTGVMGIKDMTEDELRQFIADLSE